MVLNENLHEMSEADLSEVNGGAYRAVKHTVKAGEDLSILAHKYGTTVYAIRKLNQNTLWNRGTVDPGMVILIPIK